MRRAYHARWRIQIGAHAIAVVSVVVVAIAIVVDIGKVAPVHNSSESTDVAV